MDLFVGLSGPGIIQAESLAKMNDDAIVFAMANPTPEVMPEEAAPHVRIMATGRSDYPNQINNVLAFPGIFRGALDAGAPSITEEMKLAAAQGIAAAVAEDDLAEDYIIPSVFNRDVAPSVAEAVVEEAKPRRHRAGQRRDRDLRHGGGDRDAGPGHRRQRVDRLGARRRAAGPRRRGRGPHPRPRAGRREAARVTWHAWEPTLERPPAEAFEGVDGVVNLVGESIDQRWTDEAKRRSWSRGAPAPTTSWGRSPASRQAKVLVSQSAVGYYGDRGEAISTSDGPGKSFDAEVCVEWEAAAHEVEAAGVRLAIVRTGQVLDTGGGLLGELLLPFKLGLGGPIAGGEQYMPWIHLDDEVGILSGRSTPRR